MQSKGRTAHLIRSTGILMAAFLAANSLLHSPPFSVDHLCLYSSTLHPKGALHRIEAVYPLSPP